MRKYFVCLMLLLSVIFPGLSHGTESVLTQDSNQDHVDFEWYGDNTSTLLAFKVADGLESEETYYTQVFSNKTQCFVTFKPTVPNINLKSIKVSATLENTKDPLKVKYEVIFLWNSFKVDGFKTLTYSGIMDAPAVNLTKDPVYLTFTDEASLHGIEFYH